VASGVCVVVMTHRCGGGSGSTTRPPWATHARPPWRSWPRGCWHMCLPSRGGLASSTVTTGATPLPLSVSTTQLTAGGRAVYTHYVRTLPPERWSNCALRHQSACSGRKLHRTPTEPLCSRRTTAQRTSSSGSVWLRTPSCASRLLGDNSPHEQVGQPGVRAARAQGDRRARLGAVHPRRPARRRSL